MRLTKSQIEKLNEAAESIMDSADYTQTALENQHPMYESSYLDPLMTAHGIILGLIEDANK